MVWRIVYSVLFVIASVMLVSLYPMLLLVFYAGAFVALTLTRQLNFYKIVMVLKRYASKLGARLKAQLNVMVHLGFRDLDEDGVDEELSRRTRGVIR